MTQELNILTVMSIPSLTGLITKYPTIGARKAEQKERPKLPHADFIFDQGLPASWVVPSVLSEVLAFFLRLASWGWIIFDDSWPSCPWIPLRGSCHKMDITFDSVSLVYHRGCTIEDHLWRSSSHLCLREALVMTWLPFPIRIGGLCSYLMFLKDSASDVTFTDEKSLTTSVPLSRRYELCLAGFLPWEVSLSKSSLSWWTGI